MKKLILIFLISMCLTTVAMAQFAGNGPFGRQPFKDGPFGRRPFAHGGVTPPPPPSGCGMTFLGSTLLFEGSGLNFLCTEDDGTLKFLDSNLTFTGSGLTFNQ